MNKVCTKCNGKGFYYVPIDPEWIHDEKNKTCERCGGSGHATEKDPNE